MNELIVHISKANKTDDEKPGSHNILDNDKKHGSLNDLDYWIGIYYDKTHVNYFNNYEEDEQDLYENNQYKHIYMIYMFILIYMFICLYVYMKIININI